LIIKPNKEIQTIVNELCQGLTIHNKMQIETKDKNKIKSYTIFLNVRY